MHLINEEIKNSRVRVVGDFEGESSLEYALNVAYDNNMDLVEMSESNGVSICKVMNYSKYLYEQKKAKKPQKKVNMKEIKFGCNIADNDLKISNKKATSILNEGDKVKIAVVFKGRQMAFASKLGEDIMSKFLNFFEDDFINVVNPAKLEGNMYSCIVEKKKV